MADLGKLWRPVIKGGAYPTGYFRTAKVARSSSAVREVNAQLTKAAKECKGKKTRDKSFQSCIREKVSGFEARMTDIEAVEKREGYGVARHKAGK